MRWPNAVYDWLDQLGDTSIEALAATSGLGLLRSYERVLDMQDGVQAEDMHHRMSNGFIYAFTGLTFHAKRLGLVSKSQAATESSTKRPK